MIRVIAKIFAVTATLTVCLPAQHSSAGNVAFVSATGGGGACTLTAPCASIAQAFLSLSIGGDRIICMTPVEQTSGLSLIDATIAFDCPSTSWTGATGFSGSGVFKFQHIGFSGLGALASLLKVTGGGTLILEDCVIEDITGTALDIEPSAPFNLVIKNSRISNNAGGVLLKPAAGGSVTATFDGVTIINNGGGLKTDSTNGNVKVDLSNSTISNNTANGVNIIGGAGGSNMVSVRNNVIASNGQFGIVANGLNAAALVNNTLLDINVAGATSATGSGHILTYGNNSITGAPGSGFTGPTPLQ